MILVRGRTYYVGSLRLLGSWKYFDYGAQSTIRCSPGRAAVSLALVQNHIEPDNLHNKRGICKAEVDEEFRHPDLMDSNKLYLYGCGRCISGAVAESE